MESDQRKETHNYGGESSNTPKTSIRRQRTSSGNPLKDECIFHPTVTEVPNKEVTKVSKYSGECDNPTATVPEATNKNLLASNDSENPVTNTTTCNSYGNTEPFTMKKSCFHITVTEVSPNCNHYAHSTHIEPNDMTVNKKSADKGYKTPNKEWIANVSVCAQSNILSMPDGNEKRGIVQLQMTEETNGATTHTVKCNTKSCVNDTVNVGEVLVSLGSCPYQNLEDSGNRNTENTSFPSSSLSEILSNVEAESSTCMYQLEGESSISEQVSVSEGNEELSVTQCSSTTLSVSQPQEIKIPGNRDLHRDVLQHSARKPMKCTCQSRSRFMMLYPPCYYCSSTDKPPKYRQNALSPWQRKKTNLLCRLQKYLKQTESASCGTDAMNRLPFTISNGRLQELSNNTNSDNSTLTDFNSDPSNSTLTGSPNEFSAQSIHQHLPEREQCVTRIEESSYTGPQCFTNRGAEILQERQFVSTILTAVTPNPPPYQPEAVPPPYTQNAQALPYNNMNNNWYNWVTRQEELDIPDTSTNRRQWSYNVVYAVLLGVMTTVGICGTDQPISVLAFTCLTLSFTLYLPVIWILAMFVRWKCQRLGPGELDRGYFPRTTSIRIPPHL